MNISFDDISDNGRSIITPGLPFLSTFNSAIWKCDISDFSKQIVGLSNRLREDNDLHHHLNDRMILENHAVILTNFLMFGSLS